MLYENVANERWTDDEYDIRLSKEKEKEKKNSRRCVRCSVHSASRINIYILHLYIHHKATFYMITMNTNDRFNCYCHLFWLLFFIANATIINGFMDNEDMKSASVFFRLSGGFGRNFQAIRCATDQSSYDPSNRLLDIYPEMQGLYHKLTRIRF